MNKLFLLIGVLFLIQVINAEPVPLTILSDKEYLGEELWRFKSYSVPQYYFNEVNNLEKIDRNFEGFLFEEWKYQVNKGLYTLGAKDDGTVGFKRNNKGLTLKLKGIGFYNKLTKEHELIAEANLSEPIIEGNKVSWELPFYSYSVVYENKRFRDILIMSQTAKEYLITQKPVGWNEEDIFVALVFDLNGFNLSVSDFDSNKIIRFKDNNKTIFKLPSAKVYHQNHYSGEGYVDNTGLEWEKKRIYFNGHYIEAIPFSALQSVEGYLKWNATIELEVTVSSDDAQDTLFSIDLTNTEITYGLNDKPSGVIFRDVDIEQGTIISEAILEISFVPMCGASVCTIKWWGVDKDDVQTWGTGHLVASETKTTATITQTETTDFSPNANHSHKDLNVTLLVREIITDRIGWVADNNLGFIANIGGDYARGKSISINTFDDHTDAWTLTIEFEGPGPNPCQPDVDENWVHTEPLYCYNEDINLGSGSLIINGDTNGFLGLFDSSALKGMFPFVFHNSYWKQQFTFDSNISVDSSTLPKSRIAHNPIDGLNPHGSSTTIWLSQENDNNHFVEVDLGEVHECRDVLFPIMYRFNWFTSVDANYFDGIQWNTIYHNTNFQTSDCNQLVDDGSTFYCDLNLSIGGSCSKVRFQVEHDSAGPGAVSDNDSTLGMNNVIIMDRYDRRIKLTLFNSSLQVINN